MNDDAHMKGFEKEDRLRSIWSQVNEIQPSLYMWKDFIDVARWINPDLCARAFERRTCRRTLRYVGHVNWPEPDRTQLDQEPKESDLPLIIGKVYEAIDFNGATYSIKVTEGEPKVIGCVYFEVLNDNTIQ